MNYTAVTNLKWADEAHTAVNADVTFDRLGVLPFTASPDDVVEHGVQIYNECINGDYGPIGEFE